MSDKELLELAAKAAGITGEWCDCADCIAGILTLGVDGGVWNPLTDDGDALRLAVKLDIDISFYTDKEAKVYAQTKHVLGYGADGYASYQAHEYCKELYEGSYPLTATRRAIVRAAASMGAAP